jgi:hypothetical protein
MVIRTIPQVAPEQRRPSNLRPHFLETIWQCYAYNKGALKNEIDSNLFADEEHELQPGASLSSVH